jgi:hypothetical protein
MVTERERHRFPGFHLVDRLRKERQMQELPRIKKLLVLRVPVVDQSIVRPVFGWNEAFGDVKSSPFRILPATESPAGRGQ